VYAQTYQFTADASHLGVPVLLKTPAPGSLVARKTLKEVYEQIITDLKTGERLLRNNPMARDQFLVSYQAAWGLLSRVYLYMGQWDQSIAYADSVINKGGFTLTASGDYLNMYTSGTPASEVIWQLYNRAAKPLLAAALFSYEVAPNKKLLALFDAGDIRRDAMRDSVTKDLAGTITGVRRVTQKFGATGKPATQIVMDAKVIRLSEIYLNRAEAKWNKNDYSGATADVRVIAERAHNGSAVAIPVDPSSLFDFICDERSRELCFEGHRLFDIARRKQDIKRGPGCDAPVCTLTYPNVRFVLPIPQIELDANKAMQRNPGIN
jgi:hypothetical protein